MKRDRAVAMLRKGHPLVLEQDADNGPKFILAGCGISPIQARALIRDLKLKPGADAMFDTEPQTWWP